MKREAITRIIAFVGGCLICSCATQNTTPASAAGARPGDRTLMWETRQLESGKGEASTHDAQEAAERFFDSVNLVGKTKREVIEIAGDPGSSNRSIYNFPFYPTSEGVCVYRFDTGSYGWQFNVVFDSSDRVNRVEKLGIE